MRVEDMPELPSDSWAGNITELVRDRLNVLRAMASGGEMMRGRAVHRLLVFPTSPRVVHEVLVEKARFFEKSPGLRLVLYYLAGQGLFTSEGDLWRRQRRLMAPLFQPASLAQYTRAMNACTNRAISRWQDGQPLDLAREMTRITMAIVGATLFGSDTFDEADELGEALTAALQWTNDRLGSSRLLLQIMMTDAAQSLGPRVPARLQPLHQSLQEKLREPFLLDGARSPALQGAIGRLDARMQEMIEERRRDEGHPPDLLTKLLRARDEDEGGGMTDRQVRDEAVTLFVAGHETTATALAWCFYLLGRHPEQMARAQAEADACEPAGPTAYDPEKLAFLTRVFKEALRLYPPIVTLPKRTLAPVEIGGYQLPARTLTFISPYTMHHRADVYPDPLRFDPDRWLPEREAARPRSSFLPFGAGPRVCIGNFFALMEGPIVLATLLRQVRFSMDRRREIVPDTFATLRPAGGVPAVVHRALLFAVVAVDPAVFHADDAGHTLGEGRVVRDDDDGGAALAVDLEEELVDSLAGGAVEVAGGLVAEQELGFEREGAGEGDALLLATRELAGAVADAVLEADLFEQGHAAVLHLTQRLALDQPGHGDVLEGGELGEQVVKLEDEADRLVAQGGQARAGQVGGRLPVEPDDAGAGQVERADAVHQRALAGAGFADDGEHLALLDREIDSLEDLEGLTLVLVRLVQCLDLDQSHEFNS